MLSSGLNMNSRAASDGRKLTMPLHDPTERTISAISRRLVVTREALGLSQAQLCRRTGIATNTYNQWEKGIGRPGLDQANRLCDGLGITLDWIYRADASSLPAKIADAIVNSTPSAPAGATPTTSSPRKRRKA